MSKRIAVLSVLCLLAMPLAARGSDDAAAAAFAATKADYLTVWDETAEKVVSLAKEFPADKYGWRPAEGIRSVGEAFHHISNGVYLLASLMGAEMPEGIPGEMNALFARDGQVPGTKDEVVAELEAALAYGRKVAAEATPESLAAEHDFFGRKRTGRAILLRLHAHVSEHLGQEIAYARSSGVVPPWSKSEG